MSAAYRLKEIGVDAYVVDANGKDVVTMIQVGKEYLTRFKGDEIMQIICDGLNARERKDDAK